MPKEMLQTGERPSSPSHPVFSDYSHMESIGNVSFACGLREDEVGTSKALERIFPLTKVIPARATSKQKRVKTTPKKHVKDEKEEEDEICGRPDCTARRVYLSDLQLENENLRTQYKIIENKVIASRHKKSLAEKNVAATEEKNENIRAQIDEIQGRMESIEADIGMGEMGNQKLRDKISTLDEEIAVLRGQAEKDSEVMRNLQSSSVEEMQFAPKKTSLSKKEWIDIDAVKTLHVSGDVDEEDSD
jgi:chromosome segregation ATPase